MKSRIVLVLVALLVVGAGGWAFWYYRTTVAAEDAAARAAPHDYVAAWSRTSMSEVAFAEPDAASDFTAATAGLGDAPVTARLARFERTGSTASGAVSVTWTLPGGVPWTYETPFKLVERDKTWLVTGPGAGSPWEPDLAKGQTMALERTTGSRGDLLDRGGQPLLPQGAVYVIQLDPVNATRASALQLERITGVASGSVAQVLEQRTKSSSKAPIPVITYRESDYAQRENALKDVKGIYITKTTQPLGPTRSFGQPLLGSFGEATKEVIDASDGRLEAGDRAGLSGLQRQYDATLGGTPGLKVTSSAGPTLFEKAAVDGTDVETTLSPTVQEAAERALSDSKPAAPAALVAIDVPTGEVLAAANYPTFGFDRAVTGHYPPGSTFKVATSYAYLTRGITTPTSVVPCPQREVIDGLSFKNYDNESIAGSPTFAQDFAHSCNTAFVSLSPKLADQDLQDAAKALGIGADWADHVGVDNTFTGSVPVNNGATDKAAAAIGQARVEVSPLALAVMSGSIGRGTFIPPVLVRNPDIAARPSPLDGKTVAQIRAMMAQVVTDGTAPVMRDTPGGTVRGKTGTAQHGDTSADPYVWFTGYQGNTAFAVIIEKGTSGGDDAAPVAKRFLTLLAQG